MTKKEEAQNLFLEGYNCAQAVITAFCEELGLDKDFCLKISSTFGGGMGRKRLTCGAVSAMVMVTGLLEGYVESSNDQKKKQSYQAVQEIIGEFEKKYKTTSCRALLGGKCESSPTPTKRTKEFYNTRPCLKIIGDCAEILENRYFNK